MLGTAHVVCVAPHFVELPTVVAFGIRAFFQIVGARAPVQSVSYQLRENRAHTSHLANDERNIRESRVTRVVVVQVTQLRHAVQHQQDAVLQGYAW